MEAGLQEGPQLRERGTGRPKWFDSAAGETDEGTALVGFLARNSESDATIHTDDASAYMRDSRGEASGGEIHGRIEIFFHICERNQRSAGKMTIGSHKGTKGKTAISRQPSAYNKRRKAVCDADPRCQFHLFLPLLPIFPARGAFLLTRPKGTKSRR